MNRDELRKLLERDPEAILDLIEKLFAQIEELKRRLHKDSHNSNRPPSSDGLNRRERRRRERESKKKRGGQEGHEGKQLKMSAKPTRTEVHTVATCARCKRSLEGVSAKGYKKRQVFDIPPVSLEVTEHLAEYKECPHCRAVTRASFPEGVTRPVQYGSRIKAFITYLSQYQLIPYERTVEMIHDLFGVRISTGTVYNVNQQAYEAGKDTEEKIKALLKNQPVLHADETGLYAGGSLKWLHVLSTNRLSFYSVHDKRGKEAIEAMGIIPGYNGCLVHDFWSSYLAYGCKHILCNAHLVRELTGIYEDFGQRWALEMKNMLLEAKKKVDARMVRLNSGTIHTIEQRYERIIKKGLRQNPDRDDGMVRRGRKKKSKPRNLLERLKRYQNGILAFVKDFSIPFDNNQAERDLRMVKVQQKISGCFRSMEGCMFFARIRGYISTAKKHNENVLTVLQGLFENRPFMPQGAE
jgi:transposase